MDTIKIDRSDPLYRQDRTLRASKIARFIRSGVCDNYDGAWLIDRMVADAVADALKRADGQEQK
jgi:hypothetical protein